MLCRKQHAEISSDEELETLLHEDSYQAQAEPVESLGVDHTTVPKRLKASGIIQKQGHWMPCESKLRDIERCLITCEQLLQRQKRKGFLHCILTGDEKWIHYDNPKHRRSWGKPSYASTLAANPNTHGSKLLLCIWWNQLGVVYYEQLKSTKTIMGDRYRLQLMRLSRALKKNQLLYEQRHDKVILQHDKARPHVAKRVKTYLNKLKWNVQAYPSYSPDITPSDYHLFRSMANGLAE